MDMNSKYSFGLVTFLLAATMASTSALADGSLSVSRGGGCCASTWGLRDAGTYRSKGTGYYPDSSAMEGGFRDRKGKPLRTLQSFLKGGAAYVSTAMDPKAFAYGQQICIPELNDRYGTHIKFRVVDTGGAFMGKGTGRIDVCTGGAAASQDSAINGHLTIVVCK